MLENRAYHVARVVIHQEPHEDELNAYEQALMFGQRKFSGVVSAPIVLVDAGLHTADGRDGDWHLEKQHQLWLGAGGGQFDEHGAPKEVRADHSASTRMADWLGIRKSDGMMPILEYSHRTDRQGGSGSFELANLIKSWWAAGVPLATGMAMYRTVFRSFYHKFAGRRPVKAVQKGEFEKLVSDWLVGGSPKIGTNGDGTELIAAFIQRKGEFAEKTDFDLEGLYDLMVMSGVPENKQREFVHLSLFAKQREQQTFVGACKEFEDKLAGRTAGYAGSHTPYRIAVIESASRMMNRAVRHLDPDCDVLVQLRPDGSAGVFDLHKRLNLNPVAAQLRMAELSLMKRERLLMVTLLSEGTVDQVRPWFLWAEGHAVFNRTYTAPNAPITHLVRREIVEAVAKGLKVPEGVRPIEPQRKLRARILKRRAQKAKAYTQNCTA